jgi:hypothetical protein
MSYYKRVASILLRSKLIIQLTFKKEALLLMTTLNPSLNYLP